MLLDQLVWLARGGEVNRYYFSYGLDRKDAKLDQYMPYRDFRRIRNNRNRTWSAEDGIEHFEALSLRR